MYVMSMFIQCLRMCMSMCIYIYIYMCVCVCVCISLLWFISCPVGWDCRIHRLQLYRGVRPPPNEFLGYDTKQSDGEVPVIMGLWGMRSTPSLPLLPGPLWPGMVAPDRALSMG